MEGMPMADEPRVSGETAIRVRYAETDRMGLLHHANYLVYFEQARTELLRSQGLTYRDLEDQGFLLVLTSVERVTAVRIDHRYEVRRGETLVAEGKSTLACVGRDGRVQPLPDS